MIEHPRDRVPLDWAATQHGLGLALTELGDRTGDLATIQAAIAALRSQAPDARRVGVSPPNQRSAHPN